MKKYLLPIIAIILVILILGAVVKATLLKTPNAGLQVNSIPSATVLIDDKEVGKTPYEDKKFAAGEKKVRLVPESTEGALSPWEVKVKLVGGTLALVSREFGENEDTSASSIIVLEPISDRKTSSLLVVSRPDSSLVKLDGEAKGFTPLSLDKISKGEHEITISSPDYKEMSVRTKFFEGLIP